MTSWTWRWSHDEKVDGDTTRTAVSGREFATQEEAERDIAECERLEPNVYRHESPGGESTYRKVLRVVD